LNTKLDYLYKAIDDTQQTIRFLDTKAAATQIVGIFLAAYLTKIGGQVLDNINQPLTVWILFALLLGGFFYLLLISSIIISFKAINPMSSPHEHIVNESPTIESKVDYFLFKLSPKPNIANLFFERSKTKLDHNVSTYYSALMDSEVGEKELLESLVVEFHKLSYIRAMKMYRIARAILLLKWSILTLIPLGIIYYYLGWI